MLQNQFFPLHIDSTGYLSALEKTSSDELVEWFSQHGPSGLTFLSQSAKVSNSSGHDTSETEPSSFISMKRLLFYGIDS